MPTKFISFDRLSRYTQNLKSYVGAQIQAAKTEWQNQLKLKVDKVTGKGLSTNDFTNEYKSKLDEIESGAQVNTVTGIKGDSESAYRTGNVNLTAANIGALEPSGDASNTKVTFTQSSGRVNLTSGETLKTSFGKLSKWFADLKAVAFSGSYNDLSNKPTAFKNPQSLTIQQNGGSQTEYDGSTKLAVNITKAGIGLGNVENKSSATIRSELTSSNVTTALGYTPVNSSATELTNQNLDAYKGTGYMGKMYYGAGGNSVTGKPSGVDNFWMLVVRTGVGVFNQLLTDKNSNLWVRYYNANSWSAWKQVVSSGMNISMLNNDKGYQTEQQVEDKINEMLSDEIGQITTFSFQIVDSLPSTGTLNHIYLVPISGAKEAENYYEEYCYINNKWELIGTTQVDLTPYAKKTDIPTALKNPNAMTLQINGTSQGTYDGSAAKTYNVTKESLGLGNVENKSSATIRGELTLTDVRNALNFDFDSTQAVSMCTHSKSGTVHTLVTKDGNTRYSIVRFVATADFTAGDTFRLGSSASTTVVTPKLENGDPLPTGAFKKNSVCIACTGDTSATVNTLFFKGGGGLSSSELAAADAEPGEVLEGVKFYAGDKTLKTGTMPNQGAKTIMYAGSDVAIPEGFHNGSGKVTVDGGNQGAKTAELGAGGTYGIPKGWHNGNGRVTTPSMASLTAANAEDRDIISSKTAWVNGSKRTGTLQDLGYEPKGTGCTLYNGGVYIYFGDSSSRYALSRSVWYPQGNIKNILSFSGSGSSGDKSGDYAEIFRNESNWTREIQARSHASASISGKTVTITVHAEAYQRANDIPSLSGTKSSVDYSFSFNIG